MGGMVMGLEKENSELFKQIVHMFKEDMED